MILSFLFLIVEPISALMLAALVLRHRHTLGIHRYARFFLAILAGGLVVHAAGPFIKTFRPMVEACIKHGKHYCDIDGEIAVIEGIAEYDAQARAAGVMLLPAAGFDVVPSDVLVRPARAAPPREAAWVRRGLTRGTRCTTCAASCPPTPR